MPLPRVVAAATAAVLVCAGVAQAQSTSSFTIVNQTGEAIVAVYAGPSTDPVWGPNILQQRIRSGETMILTLQTGRQGCLFDLKYDFADGDTFEEYEVDVCRIRGEEYILE